MIQYIIEKLQSFTTQSDKIKWLSDNIKTLAEDSLLYLRDAGDIKAIESWTWINDYIRYIASTEDPIQTLSDLLNPDL